MSDLTQIKTITGVASGFNDTSARQYITELSGAIDYVSANAGSDNNIYYTTEGYYGQDLNSAYEAGKSIVVKMNNGELLPVYKRGSNFYGYYISECWSSPSQLKVQEYIINLDTGYTINQTVNNPGVADWNCTNSADLSYIKNKPYIPDISTIVQYGASSLYFPNSNFKVDTSGNVYKITKDGEETQVTGKAYIDSSEISFVLNGTFEPGTYEFRMPDHYLTLTNPDGGTALTVINGVAKWVNTSEKTFSWKYLNPGPRGEPYLTNSNGSIWQVPNEIDLKYQLECDMSAYVPKDEFDNLYNAFTAYTASHP